jgi:F1F0 ATPase subunit 2
MTSAWTLPLALAAGVLLGGLYFQCLWLTARQMAGASRPAVLWAASFALRAALLLAGFFLLAAAGWQQLTAGGLGFLAARAAVVRRQRPRRVPTDAEGSG